jgi:glyoxylase I family protein
VHHVAVICTDYDMSKYFYIHVLGLTVISEIYREDRQSYKMDLALGDYGQIELFTFPDAPVRRSYPEAAGLRYLAFAVEDIHAAIDHLLAHGITVEPIMTDSLTQKS